MGSGWSQKVQQYSNYSIPLFLSEFGCITNPPRDFSEIQALSSSQMTSVYSGGLVYEYSNEPSNPGYGIVNIESPTSASPKNPEFSNVMRMLKGNVPSGDGGYKTNLEPFTDCPAASGNWNVHIGNGLPALPSGAMKYMKGGAGKGPGLSGAGSQFAGDGSKAIVTQTAADSGYTAAATGSQSAGNAAPSVQTLGSLLGPTAVVSVALAASAIGSLLL